MQQNTVSLSAVLLQPSQSKKNREKKIKRKFFVA